MAPTSGELSFNSPLALTISHTDEESATESTRNSATCGCPRNRASTKGVPAPDYFCASYKQFFAHAHARLEELKSTIERKQRYLQVVGRGSKSGAMAGRNDPCPCGSDRKHKLCCANPALSRSYLLRVLPPP